MWDRQHWLGATFAAVTDGLLPGVIAGFVGVGIDLVAQLSKGYGNHADA